MNLINQEKKQEITGIMTAKREREPYQFARNTIPSWCSQPQSCQSDCGRYCKFRDQDQTLLQVANWRSATVKNDTNQH